jgi:hypothetical protein
MGRQFDLHQDRSALHLRSVCLPNDALYSLRCHPLTCKLLDLRLCADSTRTRFRQEQKACNPFGNPFTDFPSLFIAFGAIRCSVSDWS